MSETKAVKAGQPGADVVAGTFTDERDGQTYRTVVMPDGKVWMAQNLNYKPETGKSWCYNDDESMGGKYGRLYDWETAKDACPSGWRLPSNQDWKDLATAVGGSDAAAKKLKSKRGWKHESGNGTDEYGFSALPGGMRYAGSSDTFKYVDYYGRWWTTDLAGKLACGRGMHYSYDNVGEYSFDKGYGLSVRCVQTLDPKLTRPVPAPAVAESHDVKEQARRVQAVASRPIPRPVPSPVPAPAVVDNNDVKEPERNSSMKKIFIVDDNSTNIVLAKEALDGLYKTFALPSADRMFKLLEKITPDLILLDVEMPEMDGFEALSILKANEKLKPIPVIFLTAKNDSEFEVRGFKTGAMDFIIKPFSPPVLIKRIETHLEMDKVIKESQMAVRKIRDATINVIANMVEQRDQVTGAHIDRTQRYLSILVNEMIRRGVYTDEISTWDLELLLPSAQLHDVGKIVVSDLILNKPGKLTDEEFALIKRHSAEGERIIDEIIAKSGVSGFMLHAKKFAGYHHEKWDGSGYPHGLRGEEIPLEGRIMAIADVYDALVSERPYKKPFTHEQAVDIIKKDSGTHFDPKIVEVFLAVADDFWAESMTFASAAQAR
jgi:putative two-component system response regulator